MKSIGLNELRERYLRFFESKEHLRLPSFPLVPHNDPSLLLINSGMAPLKPYFTGAEEPPKKRITTCQKCIRTPDIENVGKTARHLTFFEMLGNFSFGDYFKQEAIVWAWEFFTEDLKIPQDILYASIYEEDDEAFEIWNKVVGLPAEKIVRLGKKDNFWEHGVGPCGPCSEIYFDRGADKGCGSSDCYVGCDCDRYVEVWNNVFTQFNKDEEGKYTLLENKNIDTGMGMERLACVIQGVDTLFEVDTIRNILQYVAQKASKEYGKTYKEDVSLRVITDHIRSTTMMVCDGVIPQNEGRGYVLRRLLRRAARHGKLLGMEGDFLHDVAGIVIRESGEAYPELVEKEAYIRKVIRIEEEKFRATIDQGLMILNQYIDEIRAVKKETLPGDMIFKLHDTYGFPLDLTREIAEEQGLSVDEDGFREKMKEQREMAREALLKNKGNDAWGDAGMFKLEGIPATEFTGYNMTENDAQILAIVKEGERVQSVQEGDAVVIVLDKTPFYAESGGQVGDVGKVYNPNAKVAIEGTTKTADGKYLHSGVVVSGILENQDSVTASVNLRQRLATARNHTTTHLLHKALKIVLGDHVNQAGSLVEPERLRFDFTHFTAVTKEELSRIEAIVNEKILEGNPVETIVTSVDDAKKRGATALFGEKYGDKVRVVSIGEFSMELCGGTHLKNSSQAGLFKIVSEGAVASGVRRIEAFTGEGALKYYQQKEAVLHEICSVLKTGSNDIVYKLESTIDELKSAEREMERLKSKLVSGDLDKFVQDAKSVKGLKMVVGRLDQLDAEALRNASDVIKNMLGSGVVVLASSYGEKATFIATATKDMTEKGIHAGNIVRDVAKVAGGGGGGRPDMAQAGGKDVNLIDKALDAVLSVVEAQVKS